MKRVKIRRNYDPGPRDEFTGWDEVDEELARELGFVILGNGDVLAYVRDTEIDCYQLKSTTINRRPGRGPGAVHECLTVFKNEVISIEDHAL